MVRKICFLVVISAFGVALKVIARPDSIRVDSLQKDTTARTYALDGVEVKGARRVTHLRNGALVTDVARSVLKDAGTAEDVLARIPGLQQNEDKSFTVLGKGAPLIYIDNRQVRDQSELDRLQSKDIKRVEVLQNPGAKYDATVKAVILIHTLKPKGEGWGFDVRSAHWYGEHYGIVNDLDFNYVHKGWNVFGTVHYNKGEDKTYDDISHIIKGKALWTQDASMTQYTRQYAWRGRLGTNYTFNENHSLGLIYDVMYWHAVSPHTVSVAKVLSDNSLYDDWNTLQNQRQQYNPQHTLSLYYAGKVRKLSVSINSDMSWYNSKEGLQVNETSTVYPEKDRIVTTDSKANSSLYAVKGVLGYPVWKGTLSVGSEYTNTTRKNVFHNKEGIISNSDNKMREYTLSFLMEYQLRLGKVSSIAGVRYEHNAADYYEGRQLVPGQSRTYDNVFPNVSLSFPLGPVSMDVSYTMKMQRPGYSQLDGNLSYVNRYEYMSGNPLLKPSKISDITWIASYKYFQLMGSWQDCSDVIISLSSPLADKESVLYTSTYNFPSLQNWSLWLSAAPTFGWWHPSYTLGLLGQNFHLEHFGERISLNRPRPYVSLRNIFKFPWNMQVSLDGNYTGRGHSRTSLIRANAFMNMSVIQFFLKNKALSLKLAWNDVFHSMKYRNEVYAPQSLLYEHVHWTDMSYVTLTVRYTFNSIKNKYKGTGAGREEKERLR